MIMASLGTDRRSHHRSIGHPSTFNSVPTTPLQQPRDLRFHSRSPSPERLLSNQSPRSVVSEAVTPAQNAGQGAIGVCRFESGAEMRKRRIPYVDGGNEELGPPRKEPRKTLDPDERDKLTGDMRELYDRLLPSGESEDRRARLVQKLGRILNDEYPGYDIRVNVFGSSGNLLSSSDSDVDICVTTRKRLNMHGLAELLNRHGMEKIICRASAKVPIVKCWDPELSLAADLNVNNPLALENTRMIKTYVQLDPRVRPLATIIKYWTKRRVLNDAAFGGTISSYTWICMVISFLQRRNPPILPSLQKTPGKRKKRGSVDCDPMTAETLVLDSQEESPFADDVEALQGFGNANTESQADLLFQFFRHYAYEFDYSKNVISVKEGRLLSRKEKGWDPSNYADKEARNRLCVEEPFTVIRNLGNSADDYAWSGIHGEIRRAFELLADNCQLDRCCEQFEFPPEESKPIFQRPPPKPMPILTRSASQSGRSSHDSGSTRQRKPSNRNQSSQRMGNRRASSGATFSAQRNPLNFQSPQMAPTVIDYFAAKGTLHEQLAQQYQYLQAQQEVLQRRLSEQQQATRARGPTSDTAGSPQQMGRYFPDGLANPSYMFDQTSTSAPPLTAPLFPSYYFNQNSRYPIPAGATSQARPREGASTNPSSPSLVASVPQLRRQAHRASMPNGMSSSVRSQSQPGRALPHPLTLQHPPPAHDASATFASLFHPPRQSLQQLHSSQFPALPFTPLTPMSTTETVTPKEYIGYFVGQSPQLGPQYAHGNQIGIPPVTLHDPPAHRQQRVTPELMPPFVNGSHRSRSPSPPTRRWNPAPHGDIPPIPPSKLGQHGLINQLAQVTPSASLKPSSDLPSAVVDTGGPLIVNGSNTSAGNQPLEKPNGTSGPIQSSNHDFESYSLNGSSAARTPTIPLRKNSENIAPHEIRKNSDNILPHEIVDVPETPSRTSPGSRTKPGPRLRLSSPNGGSHSNDSTSDIFPHDTTPVQAPLLSPVAEMRTPSPTHPTAFERDSPQANGLAKTAVKIANAKNAERSGNNTASWADLTAGIPTHERKGSAPNPIAHTFPSAKSPGLPPAPSVQQPQPQSIGSGPDKNPWQQAIGRRGHKKSRSSLGGRVLSSTGQPLPANEDDRKGG